MKKIIFQILLGGIIIGGSGVIGWITFAGYGGNNCDQPPTNTCECFCCHLFNSRGYESCGQFGFYLGLMAGAVGSTFLYHKLHQKPRHQKK